MGFDVLKDEAYKKMKLISSESGKCRYKNSEISLEIKSPIKDKCHKKTCVKLHIHNSAIKASKSGKQ